MQHTTHDRTLLVLKRSGPVVVEAKAVSADSLDRGMSNPVALRRAAGPAAEATRGLPRLDSPRPYAVSALPVNKIDRPIDPMRLVHEERMKTFRLLAQLVGRVIRAMAARNSSSIEPEKTA